MVYRARFFAAGLAVLLLGALTPILVQSAKSPEPTALDAVIIPSSTAECDCGVWGDVTGEGNIDPLDVMYMVNHVFRKLDALVQPASCPYTSGDADCDEVVTPLDVVLITNIVFRSNGLGSCGNPCWNTSGTVNGWTGCKEFSLGKTTTTAGPDQECIQYEYDGLGTLLLTHVNGGFNCGTHTVIPEISIGIGSITINEDEEGNPAWCLCLFDVDYEIVDLSPGAYTVRINGLYLEAGDESLEFTADLTSATSGEFCVPRTHYPWGW